MLDHLSLKFEQLLVYLRHPGQADAEVAGERRPTLELAEVEQGLVISGQLERIAAFLRDWFWFGCGVVAEAGRLADVAGNLGKRVQPLPDSIAHNWLRDFLFFFQGVQGVGPRQLGP